MKKGNIWKILLAVTGLLVIGFGIQTGVDYYKYTTTVNSAPFSVWVLVNALMYLLPAAVSAVVAIVIKKKTDHKENV